MKIEKMSFEEAKKQLQSHGFTPSGGSWQDATGFCVFSVESCAGTYGHPRAMIHYCAEAGTLQMDFGRQKSDGVPFVTMA